MTLFIDLVLLGVFVACVVTGYKKGLVKMLISCFKNLAAFLAAFVLAPHLGAIIEKMSFMDKVKDGIADKVAFLLGSSNATAEDVERIITSDHPEFFDMVERMGVDVESLSEIAANSLGNVNTAVSEYIAEPCVSALSSVIAFVIVFVVAILILKLIGFVLGLVVKLPILKTSNKILGLAMGVLLGIFWVFVISALIRMIAPFYSDNVMIATLESGGSIYSYITSVSPNFLSSLS